MLEKIGEHEDKAKGISQNEMHNKEKRETKSEQRTDKLWENVKQLKICTIRETEKIEKKVRDNKKLF